ncbi:Protein phosphatase 2C (PP2C)-like domain [Macleaya cordata]|uniref:protein-serine/threonine phosphatase n=1 Tax=Macleaya cordata TaxID=56857 RepID=A0A200QPR3_MACCD|nr:Protein phosphatase 2C (PP2C)-like domain [Macleaya cordata]
MDPVDDEDLHQNRSHQESDLTSTDSGGSSLFFTEDSRSTTSSSYDISASSSSSGEIPAAVVADVVVPNLVTLTTISTTTTTTTTTPSSSSNGGGDGGVTELNGTVTVREVCVGKKNKGVTWGFASIIGRRREMEDAVAVIPGFITRTCDHIGGCTAPGSRTSGEISPVHFFGVYDGHGGSQVAKFCAERIHDVVAEEWERGGTDVDEWRTRWETAFANGFERADNEVAEESVAPEIVGSTAVVVAVSGCQIITSNCGDSRAVLCRGTQTIPLTVDHKPDREDELARIEGGGGKVINWNGARVFGVLAMSRSIGDRYLRPWIIPVPEVTFTTRSEEDECLIVASDGLWDVISNDEAGEVARHLLRRRRRSTMADETSLPAAQAVADHLTDLAYRKNSSDNISVIVVDLKSKRKRQQRQSTG